MTRSEDHDLPAPGCEHRFLWHALAIVFIVAAATILFYKFYYQRGMLMHVDMTFPTSIGRNLSLYTHTWWPFGSVQNIWNTQRVFWSMPLLWAVKLLGLSTSQYLLILFVGTFALAGVSMYAFAFKVMGWSRLGVTNRYAPYLGAVFAALIFMYNPWSVSHLWPYFGYPGYAVLPLVFMLLYKAVDSPRPRYVVTLALLISITSTGPIIVVWFWTLILTYLLFDLVVKKFSRQSLKTAVKVLVPLGALYALLNAMWIMPVGTAQLANKPFIPIYPAQLNQATLDMLSSQNSVINNLRFASGWMQPVNPQVSGSISVILSFALPALALAALLLLRKKIARDRVVIYWSMMFVLSILLATGSAFILRRPYSYFALRAPGVASYGWVLRVADRWLCFAPVFYALVLGLLVAKLLGARNARGKALAAALVAVVLVSFGPITLSYARTVYNPTRVPSDYDQVNRYIEKAADGARPIWMPFSTDGFRYYWAPEKRIRGFDVYSSNPNLNNFQDLYGKDSFYYWLESLFTRTAFAPSQVINADVMLPKDLGSRLLLPFSARYLILDSSVPGYRFGNAFDSDSSMKLALKTDILKLFELKNSAPFIRAAARTVAINTYYDELALMQKLSPDELSGISFSESGKPPGSKYGVIDFNDYNDYFDINSGFEVAGADGLPLGWTQQESTGSLRLGDAVSGGPAPQGGTQAATVSTDTSVKSGGRQSLRVENRAPQDLAVSEVTGPEVAVTPGDIYTVQTSVKYLNSKWTHVLVEGYETKTGKWVTLVKCPAVTSETSSNWKNTDCSFFLPAGFSRIRPVLVSGWVADTGKGPAVSWFDNIKLAKTPDNLITDLRSAGRGPTVKYQRVSAEKYRVQVEGATEPFVLSFGEAFDPLWEAKTSDGHTIDPVRLYKVTTGFPIDRKGSYEVTIEYMPQRWFVFGLVISLCVSFLCLIYLAYSLVHTRLSSDHKNRGVPLSS